MKVKVLSAVIMLCIWVSDLSAQEKPQYLAPLASKSTVWYTVLIEPPLTCQCLKNDSPPQKQGPIFSIDIPISPFWDTVQEDRIKNRTIQFGGSATPLKSTVAFGGWLAPRVIFTTPYFRTTFEGGVIKTLDLGPSRTMKQGHLVLEGSLWHVLVGAEGLFGQEEVPQLTKGINFEVYFRRRSYGGQGWLGAKFGDFNRSFVAGRYGRGYARTEGATRFNVPNVNDLDWLPVYLEEFRTTPFSVEGKAKAKRISQSIRFDRVEYERMALSPDPLRFGENRLEDRWLRTETEVVPFSHARALRGVVIWTKDFRDQNRLMFINDYSSVRVLLRFTFN